ARPDLPTAGHREEPHLAVARLAPEEREHGLRIGTGQPFGFGHARARSSIASSAYSTWLWKTRLRYLSISKSILSFWRSAPSEDAAIVLLFSLVRVAGQVAQDRRLEENLCRTEPAHVGGSMMADCGE